MSFKESHKELFIPEFPRQFRIFLLPPFLFFLFNQRANVSWILGQINIYIELLLKHSLIVLILDYYTYATTCNDSSNAISNDLNNGTGLVIHVYIVTWSCYYLTVGPLNQGHRATYQPTSPLYRVS